MAMTEQAAALAATWNWPGDVRSLRLTQPSVAPQCYGAAPICQPLRDLPFRPSPQVKAAFRPAKFRAWPAFPAPAVSRAASRWRTVPGRP